MTQDILDTLANLRGLSDSELSALLDEVARGDPEGLEWALARYGDLTAAGELVLALAARGLEAGGWRTVADYAASESVTTDAIYQRLARTDRLERTRGPGPAGHGPQVQTYVRAGRSSDEA